MDVSVFQRRRTLFLAWVAPGHGSSRTRQLAEELGVREVHHVTAPLRATSRNAPLRYGFQALSTLRLLLRKRPGLVFVQSPPSHAVLVVRLYSRLTGARYIVDAHTDALQRSVWLKPSWLHDPATREALVTLVHDDSFERAIVSRGGRAMVLRDPIGHYASLDYPLDDGFSVAVVNQFAEDEPVEAVVEAAALIPSVRFYVTGNTGKARAGLVEGAPSNLTFTGFLPDREYYGLLKSSDVVMSLTTRDHTFQCGANEALSLERPVITSAWPGLRSYFFEGAVFVDNTSQGILEGVREMVSTHEMREREIRDLRAVQRAAWEQRIDELAAIVETAFAPATAGDGAS